MKAKNSQPVTRKIVNDLVDRHLRDLIKMGAYVEMREDVFEGEP